MDAELLRLVGKWRADGSPYMADCADELEACLSVAQGQGQGWRPIESAPEDGWFLAFKPGVQVIVGTILDGDHPDCEFDGGVHEAWSHQHVDGITHWQPLPAAPAQPDGVGK